MYLIGFGVAAYPPLWGSRRDPEVRIMTVREVIQRMKKQREADVVEQVRALLGDNLGECTVYRPTSRWQSILETLEMNELERITACVTCYNTSDEIFSKIEAILKGRYKAVVSSTVDDLGYRRIFVAGPSADAEPSLLLCVNYYEDTRASVKAQFGNEDDYDSADSEDVEDLDFE
jgi:hypothetical protein